MPVAMSLDWIQSRDANETTADNIRVLVDRNEVWSGSMHQGQTVDLRGLTDIVVRDSVNVQVWEVDDWEFWPLPDIDKDDFLGEQTVNRNQGLNGTEDHPVHLTLDFPQDGHYQIGVSLWV